MTDIQLYLTGLVALGLNLITRAMHASLLNARTVSLLALRETSATKVDRTLELISRLSRLRLSFHFAQMIYRFLLAGTALLLFARDPVANPLAVFGSLILAGVAIWFLEFLAEWFVLRDPEAWALRLTPFASLSAALLTPVLAIPLALFRMANIDTDKPGAVTEDELKTLVDAGQQEGVLEQDEREMIFSIFRFGDTLAREIMVPRIDVLALDAHTPAHEAVDSLLHSGFSRCPIYEGTIDNVIGLLYAKDLLRVWREGTDLETLRDLMRPAYFVPEAKKAADLLTEMQAQRVHMAVVVDEYGGMAGVATLEDIVEEIIGEVQDEYDQGEEQPYQQLGDEEYLFPGRIDLDDFNVIMNTAFPREEADTLGGLIYSRIGRVPKGGENLQTDDILLTVEQVTGRRIRKVRAQRVSNVVNENDGTDHDN